MHKKDMPAVNRYIRNTYVSELNPKSKKIFKIAVSMQKCLSEIITNKKLTKKEIMLKAAFALRQNFKIESGYD